MVGDKKNFFISYTSADRSWAEWIAWQVEEAGYTVVLMDWDFRPGTDFTQSMRDAAAQSERTLAVLSPKYMESVYGQQELNAAIRQDPLGRMGKLLGVRIADVELDPLIAGLVYIDLVGLKADVARERLLSGISLERAKPPEEPAFPGAYQRTITAEPSFPGALPPLWNVPHPRNPNFTGRSALLDKLHAAFSSGETAALTQAIAGLGGIGKTQLALEYAYRHASDYETVWWIRAEEPAELATDYAALAPGLGLIDEGETADVPAMVGLVKNWLERHGGWLLVFDNAEAPEGVRDYLPQGATGHAIVTSRNPNWRETATPLPMQVMNRNESVAFLKKRTGLEDEVGAASLADVLGDFPLALEQAGAYIDENAENFEGYLALYQDHRRKLLAEYGQPSDYPDTVATTWDLSIEKVREASPLSSDLLNLLAFFAPEEIPEAMLAASAEQLPEDLAEALSDPFTTNELLRPLRGYSLIEVSRDQISVHRLVQVVSRERLEEAGRKAWAGTAIEVVNGYFLFLFDVYDPATWAPSGALLPHALAAAGHAERLEAAPDATGGLLNTAGLYLQRVGQFSEAREVFERAVAIAEEVYGPGHLFFTSADINLGYVLFQLGDLAGARAAYERALAIDEVIYGLDHPEVALRINNLGGGALRALGDLAGARAAYERALAIVERAFDADHPYVATAVNNLGGVLEDMGDLAGARAAYERALVIFEKAYGPDHPDVSTAVNNLGNVLLKLGDLAGARAAYERALMISKVAYGPDHPDVATAVNNLGRVLQELGDHAGARAAYERALATISHFLPTDHPDVQIVQSNLDALED